MRYLFLVTIFSSCLLLKAGFAAEIAEEAAVAPEIAKVSSDDAIPEEALKIPYKERKKTMTVAKATAVQENTVQFNTHPSKYPLSITPLVGTTLYAGAWREHIGNAYNLGLNLEMPFTEYISAEAEVGLGSLNITHSGLMKDFNQYWFGGAFKFYALNRHEMVRPFLVLGLEGLDYTNMVTFNGRTNRWVGVSQVSVGADLLLADGVAFGARAGWYRPIFNRPEVLTAGQYALAPYGDSSAISSDFFRLMGSVKIEL